jgi:hypothetical protein
MAPCRSGRHCSNTLTICGPLKGFARASMTLPDQPVNRTKIKSLQEGGSTAGDCGRHERLGVVGQGPQVLPW